ncbi:branched-chain amino acid aminotransferase [Alkalihalobacillus sp. LMS39]|uniref:branched-chain amino acid aminotransferase n=1 Tax=Alkalihalobacillus sp. LMS39 TaxID=2924032 RepID=UPI001FB1AA2E|nr:branched-chain amino acid aminotransferase [Alkalihalobacillus sp. LMS39]UOE96156.1 branched-chain amino acid aminotransferase [Alkalihalobacillus sp. LMS39]
MSNLRIDVTLTTEKKPKPNADELGFGRIYTDHMFIMDYTEGKGWHDARIVPYQPVVLDPAAKILHYGQSVFEGLKAYLSENDDIMLFRPEKNMERLNRSSERVCIPAVEEEFALHALTELLKIEKEWIPKAQDTSLYIRPFIFATEPFLGLAPSKTYQFMITLSPVGAYYKEGMNPVKIAVEEEFVRAVPGGTGEAKTGGNYAASIIAQVNAERKGFSQVLWLDGKEKKYVEEVGSMNVFFKINGDIVTPALNGSILEGVTRRSIIDLLRSWDMTVTERSISFEEVYEAFQNGHLEEAFGTGTAAVISPIGEFGWKNERMVINEGKTGEISKKLYDTLTGIQKGEIKDPFGWTKKI